MMLADTWTKGTGSAIQISSLPKLSKYLWVSNFKHFLQILHACLCIEIFMKAMIVSFVDFLGFVTWIPAGRLRILPWKRGQNCNLLSYRHVETKARSSRQQLGF